MNRICVTANSVDKVSDFVKACNDGDLERVESLLRENVNIYKPFATNLGCNYVPLTAAFTSTNENLVHKLLDVYDRDLEALNGTKFSRGLISMPEDQTEEFLKTVESECDENFTAVLLKSNFSSVPKCVYLRKKLKDRNDSSLRIAKQLETKNGICDLNHQVIYYNQNETFLHFAVHYEMISVVERLLSHSKIDKKCISREENSLVHYAILTGNLNVIKLVLSNRDCNVSWKNSSFIHAAVESENLKTIDFVIEKMVEIGIKFNEILSTNFTTKLYYVETQENLIHVLAKSSNFHDFYNRYQHNFDEETFCLQDSNGNSVLHHLVIKAAHKLSEKIKFISKIVEKFPSLLITENCENHLPLHLAAFQDVQGQRLFKHLHKLTEKHSGNSDIFFTNIEAGMSALEKAIEINKGLSEDYWKNFEKILQFHGPRLLQKCITADKTHKSLKGIFSTSAKTNPNDFYEGKNAFLAMVNFDISNILGTKPGEVVFKRFQLLMNYEPIKDGNAGDETDTTLFMFLVAFCEDNELLKSLIASGADCTAKNKINANCLHFAALNHKNKDIIKILLENGADPSVLSPSLGLPIHQAARHENLSAVEVLLPILTTDQLTMKFGENNETLLICSLTLYNDEFLKMFWNIYEERNIEIDVNEVDNRGDNLTLIGAEYFRVENLEFLLTKKLSEINFDATNNDGETFTHKFARSQQMSQRSELFEKFPVLIEVVNEQMNMVDIHGCTPVDQLLVLFCDEDQNNEDVNKLFQKIISLDNLKENFRKTLKSLPLAKNICEHFPNIFDDMKEENYYEILQKSTKSLKAFEFIVEKFSKNLYLAKNFEEKNVLHLVCEKNDPEMVNLLIKVLESEQFEHLIEEKDVNAKKPFELFNDSNKFIFEKCFE